MKTALLLALALVAPGAVALSASSTLPPAPAAPTPAEVLLGMGLAQGVEALPLPALVAEGLREEILELYLLSGVVPSAAGVAELDARLAALAPEAHAPVARILAAHNEATRLRSIAFAALAAEDAAALRAFDEPAAVSAALAKVDLAQMHLGARIVTTTIAAQLEALRLVPGEATFLDPFEVIEIAGSGDDVHDVDRTLLIDLGGDDLWSNNAGATKPDFIIDAFPGCITTGAPDCTILGGRRNSDVTNDLLGRRCHAYVDHAAFEAARAPALAQDAAADQLAQPSLPGAVGLATREAPAFGAGVVAAADLHTGCLPQGANDVGPWASDFLERGTLRQGDEHSVAIGIDLSGDDTFAPPREFNDINDGDNAAGCDTRSMGDAGKLWSRNLTAGGAFAGIGVLWDGGGADFYGGRSIAQGSGHVAGVGVLVDDGPGDDIFSAVRLSQGVGFFAGLGLLYSGGDGNDRYALENDVPFFNEFEHFIGCDVSTRDGQGRGNFNGVGALVDMGGDDTYFVQDHDDSIPGAVRDDPLTTQGSAGARLQIVGPPADQVYAGALGVLWDARGFDSYSRAGRANNVVDPSAKGFFRDGEEGILLVPFAAALDTVRDTVDAGPPGAEVLDQAACLHAAPCDALGGDAGAFTFRPCRAEPRPQDGLFQWLVWYGVQAAEQRALHRPTGTPLNVAWPLPEVFLSDDPAPRVCDRRDLSDEVEHRAPSANERTFYFMSQGEPMAEEPPAQTIGGPQGLVVESRGGRSFARASAPLEAPMMIATDGLVHAYLAHREPVLDGPQTYYTQVVVTLAIDGMRLAGPDGQTYALAEGIFDHRHPGGDVDRAQGWTDLPMRVNASGVLPESDGSLVVPQGAAIIIEVRLLDGPAGGAGDLIAASGELAAQVIEDSQLIPSQDETPSPVNRIDLEEQLIDLTLRPVTRSLGQSVTAFASATAPPTSTFRIGSTDAPSHVSFPLG